MLFSHGNVSLSYVNEVCICLEICLSSRFMWIVLWPEMTHLRPMLFQNASCGWGAWCNSLSFEAFRFERATGRKDRGLQTEEVDCKCQTFFISLLSGRRKQTSVIFCPLLYTNLKWLLVSHLLSRDNLLKKLPVIEFIFQ